MAEIGVEFCLACSVISLVKPDMPRHIHNLSDLVQINCIEFELTFENIYWSVRELTELVNSANFAVCIT